MFSTAAFAIAMAIAPALAIPPPEFGFVDSGNHTELSVAYTSNGNTTVVQEGQLFGGSVAQSQPVLALDPALYKSVADYNGQYLILMVDPDAPSPENPTRRFILHWLAANVTQSETAQSPQKGRQLTNATANAVPYNPPQPPTTSAAHRYILYAFEQPANFVIPEAYSGFSATNRTNFNLTGFIEAAGLSRPAAGEYFYASRQDSVPGDFIALPGGQYPGGNGNAIFVGSSGGASPSASGSGPSSTGGSNAATQSGSPSASATGSTASSQSSAAAAPLATARMGGVIGVGLLGLVAML